MTPMVIGKLSQKFQLHIQKWFSLGYTSSRKIQAGYSFQERLLSACISIRLVRYYGRPRRRTHCVEGNSGLEPMKVNRQATVDGSYIASVSNVDVGHAPEDLKLTIEDTNVILEVLGKITSDR